MNEPRSMVKNAADAKQVKRAEQAERRLREDWLNAMRAVITTPKGREFIWGVLAHCKVFETIWHPSALIHYNSGLQDAGHWLMKELNDADQDAFLLMITEANARKKRTDAEREAMHTQQATSPDGDRNES